MPAPGRQKFIQLAYKVFNQETKPGKTLDGCRPINGGIPIPIGPPKRDPLAVVRRWKPVHTVRMEDGSSIEVAIRHIR